MRGVMGCCEDLAIGTVIQNGTSTMVVRARMTEEQARVSAEEMGIGPLANVAPGELFYEVEVHPLPPHGSEN